MDTNPYQSPQTDYSSQMDGPGRQIWVEGRSLVVPTDTVLPPVCIRTNQPVTQADMQRKTLYWCTPWVLLLLFIHGLLIVIAYFLLRKRLTITYGLAPEVRQKCRKRVMIKSLIAIGLFLMMIAAGGVSPTAGIVLMILFSIALIVAFVGNSPLSVTNYRRERFWVKGCCDAYLARLEMETGQDPFLSVE